MILVTSLSGESMYINHTLIEKIQEVPDTILHLTTEKSLIVKEKADEIIERVVDFHKRTLKVDTPKDFN